MTDLRFFVSDIVLQDSAGNEHALTLQDNSWQQSNVALIDLESGNNNCDNGSSAVNDSIVGVVDAAEFVAIRFVVGVPFEQNHANPLLAKAPLDNSPMHWHWRSGYKFIRAGIRHESDGFWLHLGSTACEGKVQAISACANPNRVEVHIEDFSPATDTINVDLAALFAGVNLGDGTVDSCSSSPAEETCRAPFAALGLAFGDTGASGQTVFRAAN